MDYVLIEWPESQVFMEEPWFEEEAVLHYGLSSAYFIPKNRICTLSGIIVGYETLISNIYGKYITKFMEKIKEYEGNSIELWKQELLGNITKEEFVKLIKTDKLFNDTWGQLLP
jgi:hypothetical protein